MSRRFAIAVAGFTLLSVSVLGCRFAGAAGADRALRRFEGSAIGLQRCSIPGSRGAALCGTHRVFEDREAGSGRTIELNIVVLPALEATPEMTPVFYLAGGPGGAATDSAAGLARSWMRERRDIVLVDQRGTGRSHPLACPPAAAGGLQDYLGASFGSVPFFEACRAALEKGADLRLYTTPIAMDDLNEVRGELGYELINLRGGSYGTRAALVYMRRHPQTVRTAVLSGIAPIAFTNPLYHAREAQTAIDRMFAECTADRRCGAAFPHLADKLDDVLARLEAEPATVTVRHPTTGVEGEVLLSREAFADGLRVFLYYMPRARSVPLLIEAAWEGRLDGVAQTLLESNWGLATQLAMGMLLSVTCAADIPRIDPQDIPDATRDTFLGDSRVRQQIAACGVWPRGGIPDDFAEPVSVDVPVLLFSGTMDPVTGPRWGEEAAAHLSNSLHLIVPGAHGVAGACTDEITRRFLRAGSVSGLDTGCLAAVRLPPFVLPR